MDDRAYTMAMAGYALMQERRKGLVKRPKTNNDNLVNRLTIRKGRRFSSI